MPLLGESKPGSNLLENREAMVDTAIFHTRQLTWKWQLEKASCIVGMFMDRNGFKLTRLYLRMTIEPASDKKIHPRP